MKGRKKQTVKFKPAGSHDKFKDGWSFMAGPDVQSLMGECIIEHNPVYQWCVANLDHKDWCTGSYLAKSKKKSSDWVWASVNGGMRIDSLIYVSGVYSMNSPARKTWFMFRNESDMVACKLTTI